MCDYKVHCLKCGATFGIDFVKVNENCETVCPVCGMGGGIIDEVE